MAAYGYEAIDKAGKTVSGSIEAESIDKVRMDLKQQGLTVLEVKEQSLLSKDLNISFGGKPTTRDLSVFCRQFVSMNRAGVSILSTLKMLDEQTENKVMKEAVSGVRVSVEKGETFSSALAQYPKVFPELMVSLVAAGESSGSLDIALERMAVQFEKSTKIKSLVKKAMIYPVVVAVIALVVMIVMLVFVIPRYGNMFAEMDAELPGITLFMLACGNFLRTRWYIVVPVLAAVIVGLKLFSRTDSGKHVFHGLKLKIAVMKNLEIKQASSMMARTMSTLLASGVPIIEAVDIVGDTMENVYFKEAMDMCKNEIMIGQPLSRPLEQCGLFPPMVYHMVKIGEEAGNTEEMLTKLADYYDEEVEIAVQSLMAAMEPMIIVMLAGIVSLMIAAVMAPMIKLYDVLGQL